MSLPSYRHTLTVTDSDITPRGPLMCGTAGDACATALVFQMQSTVTDGEQYRLEVVTGAGEYDITEPLTFTDGEATFLIPARWTAAGCAALRLIQYEIQGTAETARRYYPPVQLQFAYRDEGVPTDAPMQWQTMLTNCEAMLKQMESTSQIAVAASNRAEGIANVAERLADSAEKSAIYADNKAGEAARSAATAAETAEIAVQKAEAAVEAVGQDIPAERVILAGDGMFYAKGSTVEHGVDVIVKVLNQTMTETQMLKHNLDGEREAREADVTALTAQVDTLSSQVGAIDTGLDAILARQKELIGGGV